MEGASLTRAVVAGSPVVRDFPTETSTVVVVVEVAVSRSSNALYGAAVVFLLPESTKKSGAR